MAHRVISLLPSNRVALFQVRFKIPLHVASEHQSATTAS